MIFKEHEQIFKFSMTQVRIAEHEAPTVLIPGVYEPSTCFAQDLVACCPKLIATQHPLTPTLADFWQMVYEQGTELIVMLANDLELHKVTRWPLS